MLFYSSGHQLQRNCQNITSISCVFSQNDNHSIVETYVASKTLVSQIPIPMVENRNKVNSDFKTIAQNDSQYRCLDVMSCGKTRSMEYI